MTSNHTNEPRARSVLESHHVMLLCIAVCWLDALNRWRFFAGGAIAALVLVVRVLDSLRRPVLRCRSIQEFELLLHLLLVLLLLCSVRLVNLSLGLA